MRLLRAAARGILSLAVAWCCSFWTETGRAGAAAQEGGISPSPAMRDAFGIALPDGPPPMRIVSLSPNLTEILFAVGVSRDRIVGVTRFCDYPPAVEGIARVGGIVDPSIESILALEPDLVLATRGNPTAILARLRAAKIPTYAVESQGGIAEIYDAMRELVRVVAPDDTARAGAEIRSFRRGFTCLREAASKIPLERRPRVYYYDPASPDWTAGPGTHVSEAIGLAGGKNIGDEGQIAWPRLSAEVLLVRSPEVILVASIDGDTGEVSRGKFLEQLRDQQGLKSAPAVRAGRICIVPADWLLRPGPRVIPAIRMIGRCLHPEVDWGCGR